MPATPQVALIAALCNDRVIGRDNAMPWHLSADLKRFRALTWGHRVIMGRKTFASILASLGNPLPGRDNVVVSRSGSQLDGVTVADSFEAALTLPLDPARVQHRERVFVIGGGQLYAQALAIPGCVQSMHLTHIEAAIPGDTFFPGFTLPPWRIQSEVAGIEGSLHYKFVDYVLT